VTTLHPSIPPAYFMNAAANLGVPYERIEDAAGVTVRLLSPETDPKVIALRCWGEHPDGPPPDREDV